MISTTLERRTSQTTRMAMGDSLLSWMSKAIPLFLALGAAGCGLGDHGADSESGGDDGGTLPGASVPGFAAPDAAVPVPGSAALPALLVTDFCSSDSLAGVSATGVSAFDFDAGDMIPLCSGWVIIANQTNERIEIRNIVTGAVDSVYGVPGMPDDLELDLDAKRVYATLPAENLVASIDLLTSVLEIAVTNSTPTSIAQTTNELLVATRGGTELRAYDKATLTFLSNALNLAGDTIVFNSRDSQLITANPTTVSVFDHVASENTLSLVSDDPANGATLALKLSPNNDRLALVVPGGNASFAGVNVINDYDSANAHDAFGAWKIEASPTSAAFSPLNSDGLDSDSDYLLASTATDLIFFDLPRHAEISRSTPASSCSAGEFDQVEFSRGGDIALAKRNCGGTRGTEFHWVAPAAGFGNAASAIGVDVAGLTAVLPTLEVDPLCTVDNLSAFTAASSGSFAIPQAADFEPLCDGWIFVSEYATNRVRLMNVITGITLSEWDLPGLPTELIIDEVNKYLFVTLPAANRVAQIDLAGPNRGTLTTEFITGFPTSITIGSSPDIWVTTHVEPGELRIKSLNATSMTANTIFFPLEVVFASDTSQIAFDRASDLLFVSDSSGFARFRFNGDTNEFDLADMDEELFDTLDSGIVFAAPDRLTIALVDQNADLVYDFDTGEIADFTDTFWDIGSLNDMTSIAFDPLSTVFGVATTDELILFNAQGDHAQQASFTPANCGSDTEARAAISRGATVGFYKSDCVVDTATTQTIFWNEF